MKIGVAISLNIKGKLLFLCSPTVPTGVLRSFADFGWVSLTRMTTHGCENAIGSWQ